MNVFYIVLASTFLAFYYNKPELAPLDYVAIGLSVAALILYTKKLFTESP